MILYRNRGRETHDTNWEAGSTHQGAQVGHSERDIRSNKLGSSTLAVLMVYEIKENKGLVFISLNTEKLQPSLLLFPKDYG